MLTEHDNQGETGAGCGEGSGEIACPNCCVRFLPKRSNKRFCSRTCQRASSRNASRGSQKIVDSPAARQRAERENGRLYFLNDEVYRKSPVDRPAFMDAILKAARESDRHLRKILTDSRDLSNMGRDYAGRPNLVRTLDDYCKRTYGGAGVRTVVTPKATSHSFPIRPLASYRDIWTEPDEGTEMPLPPYILQDAAQFLDHLRRLRQEMALQNPPLPDH